MEMFFAELIPKEIIPKYHFDNNDVLSQNDEMSRRKENLYKAMILGNSYKKKVRITFETQEGMKEVETTVWAATDNNVILKGGIYIPNCCILNVKFL